MINDMIDGEMKRYEDAVNKLDVMPESGKKSSFFHTVIKMISYTET